MPWEDDGEDEPLIVTALMVVGVVLLGLILDVVWEPIDWWKGRQKRG